MYISLCAALRRFRQDQRGNVFVLFGASSIPLLLIMGGAVDITRYTRYRAELANAVDAAALALARQHDDYTSQQATTFVTNYVAAFNVTDSKFAIQSINVTKLNNGFHVTTQASMKTIFLPLGKMAKMGTGISDMGMDVVAEVVNSSNRVELALVFDNTGSMNCGNSTSGCNVGNWSNPGTSSRIYALKQAAHTLVNTLMTDDANSFIKVGIVPFEGAVNTGYNSNNVPSWIDWNDVAQAKYTGQNFNKYNLSTGAECTTGSSCKYVGHKWLFNKLTAKDANVKWEGCVEMRSEPYDITDTTPTAANPDTLYVPYFWPDEPDSNNDNGDSYDNNYLNDKGTFTTGSGRSTSEDPAGAQKSLTKYTSSSQAWQSGMKDTSFPYESGPNFGCPRPIVPLTTSKATVNTAIDNLVAYYSTGTFIPTGLVWGWHVLSPTEPFTQGIGPSDDFYDQTVKALVLFTDGENYITSTGNHNKSRFSGYNYTGLSVGGSYRLGSSTVSTATTNLDAKTASLCTNVRTNGTSGTTADDIRVYTITFGSMSSADEDLMRNCSTIDDGQHLYYHAPTTADLEGIFKKIGEDLADIHLSM